jgi:hypothetical protein
MFGAVVGGSFGAQLFHGRGPAEVKAFCEEVQTTLAAQVSADVHTVLNSSIKHPTPYYETQIRTERQANDLVVHDSGVIYGAWLEGVSSRNAQTSFKGYHAFGKAESSINRKMQGLIAPILARFIARLGGGT